MTLLVCRLGRNAREASAGVEISKENQRGCPRLLRQKQGWALELFSNFSNKDLSFKFQYSNSFKPNSNWSQTKITLKTFQF
jgi:hypothetical protein